MGDKLSFMGDKLSYSCPECGTEDSWKIQDRRAGSGVASFFNPEITHVECTSCGNVDSAVTTKNGEVPREEVKEYIEELENHPAKTPAIPAQEVINRLEEMMSNE